MQISVEEVSRLLSLPPRNRARRSLNGARRSRTKADLDEFYADEIDVPPTQGEIQRVKAALNRLPDVREDRVQELKARIESGHYLVSGEEIADLIVRRAVADETAA